MNCVIVDDNPLARMAMAELVSQVNGLDKIGECENGIEACNIIREHKVDLLLLDIEMPGASGIDLIRYLGPKSPVIIFTTGKKEYAVDAFELDVADYIVKPINPARFFKAIEKAREIITYQRSDPQSPSREFVFVRDNGVLRKINLDDILYMEAMGDYVKIFTGPRFFLAHTRLRSIEEKIPTEKFLKVHRSFIVALNKIEKVEEGVIVINQSPIPVADSYRAVLNSRLNIL
jgi:two-component system LytT family response regulator